MANSLTESRRRIILNSPHIASASGSIVSVNDAIKAKLKSCVVDITPVQSGSGDPSPDNERPISGWTGCNVVRCGKNLFDKTTASLNRYINNTGGTTPSQYNQDVTDYIEVKAGATYTISHSKNNTNFSAFYDENKNKIGTVFPNDQFPKKAPANAKYLRVTFIHGYIDSLQIETGSQTTDYAPYVTPTQYSITFPSEAGTVYGGTLDVTSGVLTVTWGIVDMGTLTWTLNNTYGENIFTTRSTKIPNTPNYIALMCECYKAVSSTISWAILKDKEIKKANGADLFGVRDTRFNDATTFKTAMSGVHLAYELATPLTYQLTPTEIVTLLGVNNIWADTGDISVKYWAHP